VSNNYNIVQPNTVERTELIIASIQSILVLVQRIMQLLIMKISPRTFEAVEINKKIK